MASTYSLIELVGSIDHPNVGTLTLGGVSAGLGRVSFEFETETVTMKRMPDGATIMNVRPGNQGRLKVSVPQLSPYDDYFALWKNTIVTAIAARNTAIVALGAFFFQDLTYNDTFTGAGVALSKEPPMEYDEEVAMREWVFLVGDLSHD